MGAGRKPVDWAARLALAGFVGTLGYSAVAFSLGQVLVARDPTLANRLAPGDGRITARLASSLVGTEASPADRGRADSIARRAIRQDPTAVAAISTLGLNAQIRGDTAQARRLFTYGQWLSRRDLPTQLWSIEDAVARGNIAQALHEYDVTLRTNVAAADVLFPVLASASTDPAIRHSLVRTLAARPAWGDRYVTFVAASGAEPLSTAALFLGLRQAGVTVPPVAQANTINALVSSAAYDQAWSYYASVRSGADRRRSRDARLIGVAMPSRLDWMTVDEGGVIASMQGGGGVDFAAPASAGGPLLRQEQLLPPGTYRLSGRSTQSEQPKGAQPYWTLTCRGGRELGRIDVPNSSRSGGVFSGSLTVPPGCQLQTLELVARASDAVAGVAGKIDRVELVPTR